MNDNNVDIDATVRLMHTKVAELKKEVQQQRAVIQKGWVTNSTYQLRQATTPINVATATRQQVIDIACDIAIVKQSRQHAQALLGVLVDIDPVQGYTVDQWVEDLKKRIAMIDIASREKTLAELEARVSGVLSSEEKRRLEVDALMRDFEKVKP